MENWERESCAASVKLVRYILTQADSRGLTHGEKHYLMQTALFLLHDVQGKLDLGGLSVLERHEVPDLRLEDVKDIPF